METSSLNNLSFLQFNAKNFNSEHVGSLWQSNLGFSWLCIQLIFSYFMLKSVGADVYKGLKTDKKIDETGRVSELLDKVAENLEDVFDKLEKAHCIRKTFFINRFILPLMTKMIIKTVNLAGKLKMLITEHDADLSPVEKGGPYTSDNIDDLFKALDS